jgi:hypothetical protein
MPILTGKATEKHKVLPPIKLCDVKCETARGGTLSQFGPGVIIVMTDRDDSV